MIPHKRCRAVFGDRTFECVSDRFGLPQIGNIANPGICPKQPGTRYCQRPQRDGGDVLKVSFASLLAAAGVIERDDFYGCGIVEVGYGGVVEGDMAVLAKPDEGKVYWSLIEQLRIARDLGVQIRDVASQVVSDSRMHLVFEPGSNPVLEAGGVIGFNADIFVHVEQHDGFPIDILLHEGFDQRNLRVSGCSDNSCPAVSGDGVLNEPARLFGGGRSRCGARAIDLHFGTADLEVLQQPGWIQHGGIIHRDEVYVKKYFSLPKLGSQNLGGELLVLSREIACRDAFQCASLARVPQKPF